MSTAAAPVARRKFGLGGGGQDRSIGAARRSTQTRAPAAARRCASDAVTASSVLMALLVGDDLRAENEIAGTEPRIKPAAQAPADH